ncbi:hypothetical protein [Motiliproteus sp. MSK22-1]|uniref:hypothetical protein n=1 Tax=Motiliproteus sp. MSK22-1 TaxID=1897630 RepID=UPI0009768E9F|nr:hypothetical protein [Motiliproteus sp. MSK22-1]OMH32709.1 hypothetical protein BGP75_14345 [Motiliproteus sp. MSK22-1]
MATTLMLPGHLLSMATQATAKALCSGDLKHIDTELNIYSEAGIDFQIRVLANLANKSGVTRELRPSGSSSPERLLKQAVNKARNPFLPFEPSMFVCDLGETHAVLLNKFNVVNNHLLIITKHFEDQRSALSKADLSYLSVAMQAFPALGFYNSGNEAGASQKHRHLQLLPTAELATNIPITPVVLKNTLHSVKYCLISSLKKNVDARTEQLWEFYSRSIEQLSLNGGEGFLKPYNLLVFEDWALIVPRSQESVKGISINSLGFAGLFLVKNNEEMRTLQQHGLLKALSAVAVTR